jgi:hypothetical protein
VAALAVPGARGALLDGSRPEPADAPGARLRQLLNFSGAPAGERLCWRVLSCGPLHAAERQGQRPRQPLCPAAQGSASCTCRTARASA